MSNKRINQALLPQRNLKNEFYERQLADLVLNNPAWDFLHKLSKDAIGKLNYETDLSIINNRFTAWLPLYYSEGDSNLAKLCITPVPAALNGRSLKYTALEAFKEVYVDVDILDDSRVMIVDILAQYYPTLYFKTFSSMYITMLGRSQLAGTSIWLAAYALINSLPSTATYTGSKDFSPVLKVSDKALASMAYGFPMITTVLDKDTPKVFEKLIMQVSDDHMLSEATKTTALMNSFVVEQIIGSYFNKSATDPRVDEIREAYKAGKLTLAEAMLAVAKLQNEIPPGSTPTTEMAVKAAVTLGFVPQKKLRPEDRTDTTESTRDKYFKGLVVKAHNFIATANSKNYVNYEPVMRTVLMLMAFKVDGRPCEPGLIAILQRLANTYSASYDSEDLLEIDDKLNTYYDTVVANMGFKKRLKFDTAIETINQAPSLKFQGSYVPKPQPKKKKEKAEFEEVEEYEDEQYSDEEPAKSEKPNPPSKPKPGKEEVDVQEEEEEIEEEENQDNELNAMEALMGQIGVTEDKTSKSAPKKAKKVVVEEDEEEEAPVKPPVKKKPPPAQPSGRQTSYKPKHIYEQQAPKKKGGDTKRGQSQTKSQTKPATRQMASKPTKYDDI